MMGYWVAFATTGDPNGDGAAALGAATPRRATRRWCSATTVELRRGVRAAELDFFDDFYAARLGDGDAGAVSSGAGRP